MKDERGRGAVPKPLGDLLKGFREEAAPATPLAAVQMVWAGAVGERVSAVTEVVSEREGEVTVACESAVWAQELEMMAPRILARLESEIGDSAPEKLRFRTES